MGMQSMNTERGRPMAEAQRARPMEYYNPRVLILGICFFWGVAMGFCLFYFSPPKQMLTAEQPAAGNRPEPVQTPMTAQERRRLDEPALADVAPALNTAARQPAFETMNVEPHMPAVTTEGGLTGRTAQPLVFRNDRPYPARAPASPPPSAFSSARGTPARAPVPAAPPPIPELMP